jgi:hypothetical protein
MFVIVRILPQTKASAECVGVVAHSPARRQLLQPLEIASAQNYVISLECRNEPRDNVAHCFAPVIFAKSAGA